MGPSIPEESEPASGSFTSALGSEPPSSPEVPTNWQDFRVSVIGELEYQDKVVTFYARNLQEQFPGVTRESALDSAWNTLCSHVDCPIWNEAVWAEAFRINPRPGLQANLDALAYDRTEFEDIEFNITDALPMGAPLFHHKAYTNPSNEWTDDEHRTWNPAWSYWDPSRHAMSVGPAPNGGWENPPDTTITNSMDLEPA